MYDRKMVLHAGQALLTQMGKLQPGRTKVTSEVTGGPVTQSLNCPALSPLPGTRNREEWERLPCGCPAGRGDQPRPGISLEFLVLGDHLRKRVSTS